MAGEAGTYPLLERSVREKDETLKPIN